MTEDKYELEKYDPEKWTGLLAEISQERGLLKESQKQAFVSLIRGYEALYSTNILLYDRLQSGQKPSLGRRILNDAEIALGNVERLNMQVSPEARLDTSKARADLDQRLKGVRR